MSSSNILRSWRVADLNFIELFMKSPAERQLCIEFANRVHRVIANLHHLALAAQLIETPRARKEIIQ